MYAVRVDAIKKTNKKLAETTTEGRIRQAASPQPIPAAKPVYIMQQALQKLWFLNSEKWCAPYPWQMEHICNDVISAAGDRGVVIGLCDPSLSPSYELVSCSRAVV